MPFWSAGAHPLTKKPEHSGYEIGAKGTCLQPGFHLPFVHFDNFASIDFLLQIFNALTKEFCRNAKGSIGKLI